MSSDGSVTFWLGQLQEGDSAAVEQLWNRYFVRLVSLARQKLRARPCRGADEEDIALSVFDSFCRQAEAGRFPNLNDREGLWRLLAVVTARKALHLLRDEGRQKRGGASVQTTTNLEQVLSREPSPEMTAEVADECCRLLDTLGNADLAQIALWRMDGLTVEEIADRLGYAPRSIQRKLRLIRRRWEREVACE